MCVDSADSDTLRAQLTELETLFRSAPVGLGVLDRELRYVRVNPALAAMNRRSVDDHIGRTLAELLPEHAPKVDASLRRVLATGEPALDLEFVSDSRGSGPERRVMRVHHYPILNAGRQVCGVGVVSQDITERRRATEAILERERQLSVLANALPQLVWTNRPDGTVEFLNERFYAYTGIQSLREFAVDRAGLIHPEDRARFLATWLRALRSGEPYEGEHRMRRADGAYRWFLLRAEPERDDGGNVVRWFGTCTDIEEGKRIETSLRASEAALREADQRKDAFLATLAHELRNPLAPIRAAAFALAAPELSRERVAASCAIIGRQAKHMAVLLDDLLDVSRVTSGKLMLRKDVVPLTAVIDAALESVQPLLAARGHTVAVDAVPEGLELDVDPVRITQILANLLANAAKFTEPPGRITLGARRAPSGIVLFVRDTGCGIAPAEQTRIFEMFGQVSDPRGRPGNGLGIGLALSRGLAELHGGALEVESEGVGTGSEFRLSLPSSAARSRRAPAGSSEAARGEAPCRPRRVLIADDNPDAVETLALLLELDGHVVYRSHSGSEALDRALTERPEVLVLDIGMPGLSGYQVAERVRAEPWAAHALLIAVTGWGQESDRRRARASGFALHLTKPLDPTELAAAIATHGGRSAAGRESSTA